jgi:hypothetical protein
VDYNNCTVLDAVIYSYCVHRRFFYLDHFQNFKLFASWMMSSTGSTVEAGTEYVGAQLPWYRRNYEVQELAKILKVSELEMLELLEKEYE